MVNRTLKQSNMQSRDHLRDCQLLSHFSSPVVYSLYVRQVDAQANMDFLACVHLAVGSLLVCMNYPTQTKYIATTSTILLSFPLGFFSAQATTRTTSKWGYCTYLNVHTVMTV